VGGSVVGGGLDGDAKVGEDELFPKKLKPDNTK
jgi:hypothetical protein